MPLLGRDVYRIGCDDLTDLRNTCQALQATAREDAMRADDHDLLDPLVNEYAAQLMDGSAGGDLIIINERATMSVNLVSDQCIDLDLGIGDTFLVPGSDWQTKDICKTR